MAKQNAKITEEQLKEIQETQGKVNQILNNIGFIEIQKSGLKVEFSKANEADEDVNIAEFSDEIEEWVLDELRSIGCDTAKSVLNLSVEELVKRTDLEEETIIDVRNIFKAEFE